MKDTSKISRRQLFFLIFVSRVIVILGSNEFMGIRIKASEYALASVIGIVVLLVIGAIAGKSRIDANASNTVLVLILSFIVFVLSIAQTAYILRSLFEVMYEELTPVIIALLLSVLAVFFAIKHGVEGIARLSFIVAVIIIFSLVLTLLPNVVNFETYRLSSVYEVTGVGLCAAFIKQFIFFPEIMLCFSLSGYTNEKIRVKSVINLLIILSCVTAIFYVIYEGILGSGVNLNRISVSVLSQTGEFSIFKRLDAMRIGLWIVACVTRISAFGEGLLYVLCNARGNEEKSAKLSSFAVIFISVLTVCFIGYSSIKNILQIGVSAVMMALFIVLAISILRRGKSV